MDWIEEFLDRTSSMRSPESFRTWAAITAISSVLERQAWMEADMGPLYPNMYTVLTGGPASGKSVMISEVRSLVASISSLRLAPDNPTPASFLDSMQDATKPGMDARGNIITTPIFVLCSEMGVLISKYDKDFVASLTFMYDNPPMHTAPRRTSISTSLEAPCINMLMGATPDALGDTLPETAWGQGFTSRIIFIFGIIPENQRREIFIPRKNVDMTVLRKRLEEIHLETKGEFLWEEDAQQAMLQWFNDDKMAPVPTYGKLVNYNGRRSEHVLKLSMISAISAGNGLTVTLRDFLRARSWLLSAEKMMPDVFRAMAQKSDSQIIQDLHHYMWGLWSTLLPHERLPIKEGLLWKFLETRVISDRIPKIIEAAANMNYIKAAAWKGEWSPNDLSKINGG